MVKDVAWHLKTLKVLKTFPLDVRRELGYLIFQLQSGQTLNHPHSKSMNSIEVGVNELRVRDASGAYRVFYYIKTSKGILVFHAFKKKTQKTPKKEINIAKIHLRELLNE